MEIILREYKNEDFTALSDIIRKTWNYDRFSSPKTASKLANVFLSSCLANQTYSQAAVVDGVPVGIVLVKNIAKHQCPFRYKWQQAKAIISLFCSKEGRKVSKIFGNVERVDEQLLNGMKKTYPSELALFAVDASCRGKGIGKMLFQAAMDYMDREKLEEFYLFTDTTCNFGFYEHQGMKRRGEKIQMVPVNGKQETMRFFIYEGRPFDMACMGV
ncbi:MAG: GNAT family N-acetyltransferase [Lachnospiraceae bacterium]